MEKNDLEIKILKQKLKMLASKIKEAEEEEDFDSLISLLNIKQSLLKQIINNKEEPIYDVQITDDPNNMVVLKMGIQEPFIKEEKCEHSFIFIGTTEYMTCKKCREKQYPDGYRGHQCSGKCTKLEDKPHNIVEPVGTFVVDTSKPTQTINLKQPKECEHEWVSYESVLKEAGLHEETIMKVKGEYFCHKCEMAKPNGGSMNFEKGKRYLLLNADEDERVKQNPFEIEVAEVTEKSIKVIWMEHQLKIGHWYLKENFNKRWKLFETIPN